MRMPDSSNKQTFPPSVTLQRCWVGSVGGTAVDGDTVVVVVVATVVVRKVVVDSVVPVVVFKLIMTMDALVNVLE